MFVFHRISRQRRQAKQVTADLTVHVKLNRVLLKVIFCDRQCCKTCVRASLSLAAYLKKPSILFVAIFICRGVVTK